MGNPYTWTFKLSQFRKKLRSSIIIQPMPNLSPQANFSATHPVSSTGHSRHYPGFFKAQWGDNSLNPRLVETKSTDPFPAEAHTSHISHWTHRTYQGSPRESHALAWGPSRFHTKIFRVERTRLKNRGKYDRFLVNFAPTDSLDIPLLAMVRFASIRSWQI